MKWTDHLYVGETVRKRLGLIRKRLDQGRTDVGHYLITISSLPHEQLDIISTTFLASGKKRNELPEVVGVAGSYKEALALIRNMTEDCYNLTGDADLRGYFQRGG